MIILIRATVDFYASTTCSVFYYVLMFLIEDAELLDSVLLRYILQFSILAILEDPMLQVGSFPYIIEVC